jgi:hypothetical protein
VVLVLLTAEEVPKYLDYKGSHLNPVVKVKIAIREIDKNRDQTEVKYEDLWYADGQPVGLVRYRRFGIEQCQIMLRVNQAHMEDSQLQPMANAIVRLYLDALLNNNTLYSIAVPDQSFLAMIDAFAYQRFFSPQDMGSRGGLDPSVALVVHSTTSGQNRTLEYASQ